MNILDLNNISIRFGGLTAVANLSLEVKKGEILALIGPNGAGKSTVFNLITGIYPPTEGGIIYDGSPLRGIRPYKIAYKGITRTFQSIRLFSDLTVLENVLIGAHVCGSTGFFHTILRTSLLKKEEEKMMEKSIEVLEFIDLLAKKDEKARNLSYGEQRRLEIARAIVSDPKLLLLDEPAAGMNPTEKSSLMKTIHKIRDRGVTIFLVEHDMKMVMSISERIIVLEYGKKIAEGLPGNIAKNEAVIEAYLGSGTFKSRKRKISNAQRPSYVDA